MASSIDSVAKHHAVTVGSGRRERTVYDLDAALICRQCQTDLYDFYEEAAIALADQLAPRTQWRNFTVVGWDHFGYAIAQMIAPGSNVLAWLPKGSNGIPARWVAGTKPRSRRAIIIADTGVNGDRLIPMLTKDHNLNAIGVVAVDRVPAEME